MWWHVRRGFCLSLRFDLSLLSSGRVGLSGPSSGISVNAETGAAVKAFGKLISSSMFSSIPQKRENGSDESGTSPGRTNDSSGGSELEELDRIGDVGDTALPTVRGCLGICGCAPGPGGDGTGRSENGGIDPLEFACIAAFCQHHSQSLGMRDRPQQEVDSPSPEDTFCAFARPTVVPELRRLIDGGGDTGGRNGLFPRGLLGDDIGGVNVAPTGDDGADEPALAIRRSRSRASLRCCVVKRRRVCWVWAGKL